MAMRQRGRRSAVSLVTFPSVNGDPPRLEPPETLTDDERRVFVELIGACNPRHFVASDLPLLIAFVQATVLSQHSAGAARKDDDALARWEKATRPLAMLATRLRLSPQARLDPKTLGRLPESKGRTPWER